MRASWAVRESPPTYQASSDNPPSPTAGCPARRTAGPSVPFRRIRQAPSDRPALAAVLLPPGRRLSTRFGRRDRRQGRRPARRRRLVSGVPGVASPCAPSTGGASGDACPQRPEERRRRDPSRAGSSAGSRGRRTPCAPGTDARNARPPPHLRRVLPASFHLPAVNRLRTRLSPSHHAGRVANAVRIGSRSRLLTFQASESGRRQCWQWCRRPPW